MYSINRHSQLISELANIVNFLKLVLHNVCYELILSKWSGVLVVRRAAGADSRDVYVHSCKKNLKRCQMIDEMPDVFPNLKPMKSRWSPQNPK
jgi:hypothetical protein